VVSDLRPVQNANRVVRGKARRAVYRRRVFILFLARLIPAQTIVSLVESSLTPHWFLDALATVHRWNRRDVLVSVWGSKKLPTYRIRSALQEAFGTNSLDRLFYRSSNQQLASLVLLDLCRPKDTEFLWAWSLTAGQRDNSYLLEILLESPYPPPHLLVIFWREISVKAVVSLRRRILEVLVASPECPRWVLEEAAVSPDHEMRALIAECSDVPDDVRVLAALHVTTSCGRTRF